MKNSKELYNELRLTVKDTMLNDFEDKIIYYGWMCQVEIIENLAVEDEYKLRLFKEVEMKFNSLGLKMPQYNRKVAKL